MGRRAAGKGGGSGWCLAGGGRSAHMMMII